MTQPMSAAQSAQQSNRSNDGKYATKVADESDATIRDEASPAVTSEHLDFDATFTEGSEFTPISDGDAERGMVGYWVVSGDDGSTVEVTSQLAISQDEEGLWWQVYRDTQTISSVDGRMLTRELGCGNVESVAFPDEESAWASLQGAKGSLTFEHQLSCDAFEVVDEDWYDEC